MLITFEGPDGGGKTTQVGLLREKLDQSGVDYLVFREPGGTKIGEQIRDVLHDMKNEEMSYQAELLLYSASRAQLVEEKIVPALIKGSVVMVDRFYDSTVAYQGYGRGLPLDKIKMLTDFATGGLKPDVTFLLDVPEESGIQRRLKDKHAEWNRLDAEALEFHRRVRDGYLQMATEDPRWVVVNANRPLEVVHREVWGVVEDKLAMMGFIEKETRGERRR